MNEFKIIAKKEIAPKIYEIIFESKDKIEMIPGQFITFILPKIGGRAYSILKLENNRITLIIKKRELEEGGRGGSKYICEKKVGDILTGVGPSGHFILKENNKNKLFIGTGTGFVPLYNMIIGALNKNLNSKLFFTFGIRTRKDLFYLKELKELKKQNKNFDFAIYISREKDLLDFELEHINTRIYSGYTTNFLTPYNTKDFQEIYICGAPAMIEATQEKLKKIGFDKENIFFEKY